MRLVTRLMVFLPFVLVTQPSAADDIDFFNSETGQKRLAVIIRISDSQPGSVTRILRDYPEPIKSDLRLTNGQDDALHQLKHLDIGGMYKWSSVVGMSDEEFEAFRGSLAERRQNHVASQRDEIEEILKPWQFRRLLQIQSQFHFLVYLEPQKAFLVQGLGSSEQQATARALKRELVQLIHGETHRDLQRNYSIKLDVIAEHVGKNNLAKRIGEIHSFGFNQDGKREPKKTDASKQAPARARGDRLGNRGKKTGTSPARIADYDNRNIVSELDLEESQREDFYSTLSEWKSARNEAKGELSDDRKNPTLVRRPRVVVEVAPALVYGTENQIGTTAISVPHSQSSGPSRSGESRIRSFRR